jgi:hypothetical protein
MPDDIDFDDMARRLEEHHAKKHAEEKKYQDRMAFISRVSNDLEATRRQIMVQIKEVEDAAAVRRIVKERGLLPGDTLVLRDGERTRDVTITAEMVYGVKALKPSLNVMLGEQALRMAEMTSAAYAYSGEVPEPKPKPVYTASSPGVCSECGMKTVVTRNGVDKCEACH